MVLWDEKWGTITSKTYCEFIVPKIQQHLREHPELMLQQDNAPAHTAKVTRAEYEYYGIIPMIWPASSPDLNPIEGVWLLIKERIRAMENPPRTKDEMRAAMWLQWELLETEDFLHFIDSMPQRVAAVIAANGGHTQW